MKRQVVEAVIQKILDSNWLSICDVDKVIDLVGSRKSGDAYKMLNALHCVHYADMDEALRARIPMLINEVLAQQSSTQEVVHQVLDGVNIE